MPAIEPNPPKSAKATLREKIEAHRNDVNCAACHAKIDPLGVAVVMEATHLCMSMRGVEKQNSFCVTSSMLGGFRESARTRMEFLELIKLRSALRPSTGQMAECMVDE